MSRSSLTVLKPPIAAAGKFEPVTNFTPNPGGLLGIVYLPFGQPSHMPLVVVLHGCTQNGADYAASAGWIELADRHGFAVLIPQQQRCNNFNLCFNWFERGDNQRGKGEAASIMAMIEDVIGCYNPDQGRIFITGLSAGAAMAGTMLACYPEVFAGGGLMSGLAHGVANSMPSAFQQMRRGPGVSGVALGANVTDASGHAGPWPRVSIWHGMADRTVNAANGEASVAQWLSVHGLSDQAPENVQAGHINRKTWHDSAGNAQVEYISVAQMGHGIPVDPSASDGVGRTAPYVLDCGIASSSHLICFWEIDRVYGKPSVKRTQGGSHYSAYKPTRSDEEKKPRSPLGQYDGGVGKIISDALRAAGLMR
jgi:poly(hydroxyalkanoate) depolymerase family esterase